MMVNYKEIYKNLMKARENHNDQYLTFIQYLLPEYEKTCLIEYASQDSISRAIFSDTSEEYKALMER